MPAHVAGSSGCGDVRGTERPILIGRLDAKIPRCLGTGESCPEGASVIECDTLFIHRIAAVAREKEKPEGRGGPGEWRTDPAPVEDLTRVAAIVKRIPPVEDWTSIESDDRYVPEGAFKMRHVKSQTQIGGLTR